MDGTHAESLNGGNSTETETETSTCELQATVEHVDYLQESLQVIEWIRKGTACTCLSSRDGTTSSLADKLEERFTAAYTRIIELEEQLRYTLEESGSLKEKLTEIDLLVKQHHVERIRLNSELEVQKWERFDVEMRLRNMVKDVAELQSSLGEYVFKLQEQQLSSEEKESSQLVSIKKEITEEDEEQITQQNREQAEEKNNDYDFSSKFKEVSNNFNERLQKCVVAQQEAKSNIIGIQKGLQNFERIISGRQFRRVIVPSPINLKPKKKSGIPSVVSAIKTRHAASSSSVRIMETETLSTTTTTPVTIKPILKKRSGDGTIKSCDKSKQHRKDSAVKRVKFCLDKDKPDVPPDHKENYRRYRPGSNLLKKFRNAHSPSEIYHHQLPINGKVSFDPEPEEISKKRFKTYLQDDDFPKLPYYCQCGASFSERKLYDNHLAKKLHGRIIVCPIPTCCKKFSNHESVKKHVKKLHQIDYNDGKFGCAECDETFSLYKDLRLHKIKHLRRQDQVSKRKSC